MAKRKKIEAKVEERRPGPVLGSGDPKKLKCVACQESIMRHAPTCPTVNATKAEEAATKEQEKARGAASVRKDASSHTCIEMARRNPDGEMATVDYIAQVDGPFQVKSMLAREFDKTWKEIEGYEVARAAKLYLGYTQYLGATERAMDELSRLVNVSKEEREKAVSKKPGIATAIKTGEKDHQTEKEKEEMKSVKKGSKKSAAGAEAAEKKKSEPKTSAASVCKEHILAGKLTDEKIFAAVSKEFPTFKRNYVAWYRNDMKKKGQKPPPPKEDKAA